MDDAHRSEARNENSEETLRLDDALQLAGLAATGGKAKVMIQAGEVKVNGMVETRRKRKLAEGDVVEVGDESFEIVLSEEDADEPTGNDVGSDEMQDALMDAFHEGAERLSPEQTRAWALWIEDRVADDDLDAVLIRLGGLHPDALDAVFALLPEEVDARVLDALDAVLARAEADELADGDAPIQA